MTDPGSAARRPKIGVVGTFDVANFGDLLFPYLASHELERRLGPIESRRYSHRPMATPPWPYPVLPIDDLIDGIEALDLLVVGGGHLIRFDTRVAPGYEAVSPVVPHPTGFWLAPTLVAASAGVPVAWNALGVTPDTPAWARPLLASGLRAADYVSVRDGGGLAELRTVGHMSARLVPDTAFGIRALLGALPVDLPASIVAALAGRPYVIIQASAGLRSHAARIRDAVERLTAADVAILELPISPVIGDRIGTVADLDAAGAIAVDPWPEPLALAHLIAGARAVVAQSLHLSIVAVSHGVPVLRPDDTNDSKYAFLTRFPGISRINSHSDLGRALLEAEPMGVSTMVDEQVAQLGLHWDRIAGLVASDGPDRRSRRREATRHTVAALTGAAINAHEAAAAAFDHSRAEHALEVAAIQETLAAARSESAAARAEKAAAEARHARTAAAQLEATQRAADLANRIGSLEVAIAREQAQGTTDRQRSERELAKRQSTIQELRRELSEVRAKAATLDRLQARRSFRLMMTVARTMRGSPVAKAVRPSAPTKQPRIEALKRAEASLVQEDARRADLLAVAPGSDRIDGPLVSIIVLNRDGAAHLRRLMPAIERTTYRSFEVVVVDNASTDDSVDLLHDSALTLRPTVIRNAENEAFGDANNRAVDVATGEYLLFLNNDIEPLGPGWLGRLVDTLEGWSATAVGARLVYPRRPGLENAGDRQFADLTLQHRGIEFVAADGVPTGRNLGSGADPLSEAAGRTAEVPAVTAACMLVQRDAFKAVGGFTSGYAYGTEDVDLSMKLRANGGTIVYDAGTVLWHHEYGTQNAQGRDWKRRNRTRNRQLFVDRWAPQAFREVLRDRLRGENRWSETPIHVAITLTRDDPSAGWGDYYTAHELGDALAELGWQVTYAERHKDRWYSLDPSVDIVISLLDAFDVRQIPRGMLTVAWVRNWTDRWVSHPWFDEYDLVLASSARSQEIIAEQTSRSPKLMPLATNPDRFSPRPPIDELRADVVFVGNRWGQQRGVEDLIPPVAAGRDRVVRVFGRDWDTTKLAPFTQGPLAYDRLPDVYASATIVVDDTAGPTMPYGAVNSRLFDALAAGSLVVTDNEVGVTELFGPDFPVARSAQDLEAHLDWVKAEPRAAAELQAKLRAIVLERHTYAHRAQEIRDHLLAWVEAERYSILVGIPDWEQAPRWGDFHFARGLQRQLERRGHPTRIHLLDDWNRSPSARSDVVIHLHGLSDHRPRPSQLNILWIISHPDRVTAQACDRYDLILVASDSFAKDLAPRVHAPVMPLHQATDPDRFVPDTSGPDHDLLLVANTRGVRRGIVDDLLPTVHDLAVYGQGWTSDLIDPSHVRGDFIPNEALHRYYGSARIVLNDHWPDMRVHGFLSNRLYDALGSGAFVMSDNAVGIEEEFDGAVPTYASREELRRLIDRYIDDGPARTEMAERGRRIVLDRHTFGHRADRILLEVEALHPARPRGVASWPVIEAWLDRRRRRTTAPTPAAAPVKDRPDGSG